MASVSVQLGGRQVFFIPFYENAGRFKRAIGLRQDYREIYYEQRRKLLCFIDFTRQALLSIWAIMLP